MKNLYELSIMSSSTLQDAPEHIKAKKFNIVIKSDTIITSVCLVNCCDHQNVLSQNQLSPSIFLDQKLLLIPVDRFQLPKTPTLFTAHTLFLQREYKVIISDASKFFSVNSLERFVTILFCFSKGAFSQVIQYSKSNSGDLQWLIAFPYFGAPPLPKSFCFFFSKTAFCHLAQKACSVLLKCHKSSIKKAPFSAFSLRETVDNRCAFIV